MPTFGFSAFLKLLSLNERPQRSSIRQRLSPSRGGYDYHRSLRGLAHRYMVDEEEFAEVVSACDAITNASEQRSARMALENLRLWRLENPGPIISFEPKIFTSPNEVFKVHFTPNFGLLVGEDRTAVHVWNTIRPPLVPRMVYAALSLFPEIYSTDARPPSDLAVLSLREPRFYRLSDAEDHSLLAARVVNFIERLIEEVAEELELPPPRPPEPRLPPR